MEGPVWEVVGGKDSGGIVVRSGEKISSSEAAERLSCGSRVQELRLTEKGRLHYKKLDGVGPDEGWVSINLKGNPLLKLFTDKGGPIDVTPASEVTGLQTLNMEPVKSRKVRILALHGIAHNANVMKFQVAPLKRKLGKDAEWLFLDGALPWEPVVGSTLPHEAERTEFEQRLAAGQPFRKWYGSDDGWTDVWEGTDYLHTKLAEMAPIDVVVAFSQGSCITTCLVGKMMSEKLDIPWRLNVFFHGGQIDDPKYNLFPGQSALPTIKVTHEGGDMYFAEGEPSLKPWYSQLLEMKHQDGHSIPLTEPRAGEIFEKVAYEILRHCGLVES